MNDIEQFLDNVRKNLADTNTILRKDIVIRFLEGEKRCMARIWRDEKDLDPDINHRCKSKCRGSETDLCEKHERMEKKKSWCLRVIERPPPDLINTYAKRIQKVGIEKDKDLEFYENIIRDSLKLDGHDEFKPNKKFIRELRIEKSKKVKTFKIKIKIKKNSVELKDKKINKYNSNNMELERDNKIVNNFEYDSFKEECDMFYDIDYSDVIDELTKLAIETKLSIETSVLNSNELNNDKIKTILKDLGVSGFTESFLKKTICVFYDIRSSNNCPVVSDSKKIIEKSIEQSNIDIYDMESIRLIDDYHNAYDLYYINTDSGTSQIYNQNSKSIGNIRKWIDDEGEVPEDFKTADNVVLDPLNKLPVFEIEISVKGSGFESIKPGIYREFEYDEDSEVFRTTGVIIRS
tara:strand:- start:4893 stop:6110 length:1218 start_codon:yes stop_codon:yes gene_type:complete